MTLHLTIDLRAMLIGLVLLLVAAGIATPLAISLADDGETALAASQPAAVIGTAFTYQGRLEENGVPANGSYDFRFTLHSDAAANVPAGSPVTQTRTVTNGLFSAELDFGAAAFDGNARWLEVEARQGANPFVLLSVPRQALTPTPYALWATAGPFWSLSGNAGTTGTNFIGTTDNTALELRVAGQRAFRLEPGTSPNVIGGISGNAVTAGVIGATISGGGGPGVDFHLVSDDFGTVGGGYDNQAGDGANSTSTASYATVGGGTNNTASVGSAVTVAGGRLNTASGTAATVGGGSNNTAPGNRATVGGGEFNRASGDFATVGGGQSNRASDSFATVGGGSNNTAPGNRATVGGGRSNTAPGFAATVAGGENNSAAGFAATVAGGESNSAAGDYSFAAGRRAKAPASADGSFIWADSNNIDFDPPGANAFSVRATGGIFLTVKIAPNGDGQQFCTLTQSTPSWFCPSDRNYKTNFADVDGRDVLAKLAEVPIQYWTVKDVEGAPPHMGPMAQDFYAAFGLGEDERTIATIDLDGVSLAAIKGLHAITKEQAQRIADLEAKMQDREMAASERPGSTAVVADAALVSNETLEARLAALEANPAGEGTPWLPFAAVALGLLGAGFVFGRLRRPGAAL